MKTTRTSRRRAYLTACCVFLVCCALREVAGTERGELFAQQVAVKINPDNLEAHQFLAEYYIEKGDYTEAAAEIETILRLSPDLDLASVIDVWGRLPEPARLAIRGNARPSSAKPN